MKFLNKYLWNSSALSDYHLEEIWVDFKSSLLATSADAKGTNYPSLYDRCKNILLTVIDRHKHLILDAEARLDIWTCINGSVIRTVTIGPQNVAIEALPGLILLAYTGGRTKTSAGEFLSNPRWVPEAIDYLINEKKAPIGLFLKGLVLKYGIELYLPPNIEAAEQFLTAALSHGIGSSRIELQHIGLHKALPSNISPVHPDFNGYQEWVVQASRESPTWW